MSAIVGNAGPTGVYLPAAASATNTYVQSAVTYLPSPATFIGKITVQPSTANTASQVYISSDLESSYPWSQYDLPGSALAFFINPPISG